MAQEVQNNLQKLKFRIISCSSEEPDYPVIELLTQSPQSKGWQSARFCDYPQELTLQFMSPVRLRQVQLLSHQSKIASKVEIYTYLPDMHQPANHSDFKYKKLGYLSLDSNERTDFKARELKSVYIDSFCLFMKLLFHKHQVNKYNLFNQIGIIALSAYGEPADNNNQLGPVKQPQYYNEIQHETQFDQATLDKLRILEAAKNRAIQEEDFEEAKRLKETISNLKSASVKLKQLDERKLIAIQNEDFDAAKIIKAEIDRIRNAIAPDHLTNKYAPNNQQQQYMNQHQMMNQQQQQYAPQNQNRGYNNPYGGGQQQYNEQGYDEYDQGQQGQQQNFQQQHFQDPMGNQDLNFSYQQDSQFPQQQNNSNFKQNAPKNNYNNDYSNPNEDRPIKPMENEKIQEQYEKNYGADYGQQGGANKQQNFQDHDDMVIPAVKNQGVMNQDPFGENDGNDVPSAAEPLSQQNRKLAEPFIGVLGEEICKMIFSKTWQLRLQGISELQAEIQKPSKISQSDQFAFSQAILGAISNTINDKIVQVSTDSMTLLKSLSKGKPLNVQAKGDLLQYTENIISVLMEKIGDNNKKIQDQAEESFFSMGKLPFVGNQMIVNSLAKGIGLKPKLQQSPKHLVARLSLLHTFGEKYGLNSKDVPLQPIQDIAVKNISHQNRDVRKECFKIFDQINTTVGNKQAKILIEQVPQIQREKLQEVFDGASIDDVLGYNPPLNEKKENKPSIKTKETKETKVETNINVSGMGQGGNGVGNKLNKKTGKVPERNSPKGQKRKDEEQNNQVCEFCGVFDKNFLDSKKLDIHLWKECPMLTTCKHCAQVVEVSTLANHYQEECEKRNQFKQCPRCKEPVHQQQYKKHTDSLSCIPAKAITVSNRCPLCHQDIPPTNAGWKKHLASDGCPNNERSIG